MSLVVGTGLGKVYARSAVEVAALSGVDFEIRPSSLVSFIGPSGSGKTTLLNLIGCLDRPTSGSLTVAGRDVTTLSRVEAARFRGRHLGFVFQDFKLLPDRTVMENVALALKVQGVPPKQMLHRAYQALRAVGLADKRDQKPLRLSGGEQQRVAIARALVNEPFLLLADEPTGILDDANKDQIMEFFREANIRGTTVVIATHDKRLITASPRRVVVLDKGQVVEDRSGY
jgi:cell division transport system ATP-binding protein